MSGIESKGRRRILERATVHVGFTAVTIPARAACCRNTRPRVSMRNRDPVGRESEPRASNVIRQCTATLSNCATFFSTFLFKSYRCPQFRHLPSLSECRHSCNCFGVHRDLCLHMMSSKMLSSQSSRALRFPHKSLLRKELGDDEMTDVLVSPIRQMACYGSKE